MAKSNKTVKKEMTEVDMAFVRKFWPLVNMKELAKTCNCTLNLIYRVYNGERKDRRNIFFEAYNQITAYMQ